MFRLLGLILFAPLLASAFTPDECKKMTEALSLSFPEGFPETIKAGDKKQIKLKITSNDPAVFKPFNLVPVTLYLTNQLSGSYAPYEFFRVWDIRDRMPHQETFNLFLETSPFMSGYYYFAVNVLFSEDRKTCYGEVKAPTFRRMAILNDPARADIEPPIVTELNYAKSDLALDGELTIQLKVADKNELCTAANKRQHERCSFNPIHLAFRELDTKKVVADYQAISEWDKDAKQYSVKVKLPAQSKDGQPAFVKGRYAITGINLMDVAGNLVHDLAPSLQKEFTIK